MAFLGIFLLLAALVIYCSHDSPGPHREGCMNYLMYGIIRLIMFACVGGGIYCLFTA